MQIKSKTVMSWSSRKKKEGIFCTVYFVRRNFFNICVLSQCIVYWTHFQNIHNFTYQKILLHTLLLLVFKTVESLQCILNALSLIHENQAIVDEMSLIDVANEFVNLHSARLNIFGKFKDKDLYEFFFIYYSTPLI